MKILIVCHRNGHNVYLTDSDETAHAVLYDYVAEWWENELEDTPMPEDHTKAVRQYFATVEAEYYEILDVDEPITMETAQGASSL